MTCDLSPGEMSGRCEATAPVPFETRQTFRGAGYGASRLSRSETSAGGLDGVGLLR